MRRVAIVGMHRSGTSIVARLCNLLGVDLGPSEQLLEPNEENPEGFWENHPLAGVNKRLLARLGGSWDRPPVFPAGWASRPELDDLRERAATLIAGLATHGDDRPVGFKDPRTSLTLPFWETVGAVDRVVCVVRDPSEVAASLEARDRFSAEHALMLWNRYTVAALAHAPAAHVIVHRAIFTEPERTVRELAAFLELHLDTHLLAPALDAIRPALYRSRPGELPPSRTGEFAGWLHTLLVAGDRPEPTVLRTLDDAYNGRHLALGAGDGEVELVSTARLREVTDAAERHRRRARRQRRDAERLAEALEASQGRVAELERRLESVYDSRTWRAGRVVVGAPAALRRRWR